MTDPSPTPVIFILGAGRCGSTLLNLILDSHPEVLGLNEIACLEQLARRDPGLREAPLSIPFWKSIESEWTSQTGRPLQTIKSRSPRLRDLPLFNQWREARRQFLTDTHVLFHLALRRTDSEYVVDASKSASRAWLLSQSPLFELFIVHLVRDGRAVVNSFMRSEYGFMRSVKKWGYGTVAGLIVERLHPEQQSIRIKYEELALHPERTVHRLFDSLDVAYDPEVLNFQNGPHVGPGGNPMTFQPDGKIVLDERWRKEMSDRHERRFHVVGEWLNSLLGYHRR